jgi:pSer/pThr/pTyr-binding forkhead associated (FHA) protein
MKSFKIIVLRNDGSDGVHFPVPKERSSLVFGRSVTCDVRIDRNTVSGEHAKMERDAEGQWTLRHLSSSNPTFLNGNSPPAMCSSRREAVRRVRFLFSDVLISGDELAFPQKLRHGDIFTISRRRFRFEIDLAPKGESVGFARSKKKKKLTNG